MTRNFTNLVRNSWQSQRRKAKIMLEIVRDFSNGKQALVINNLELNQQLALENKKAQEEGDRKCQRLLELFN